MFKTDKVLFYVFTQMPNPGLRLKEPAIAGYVYNPPQTPPFEKEGLCCKPLAYLTEGESAYRGHLVFTHKCPA